MKISIKPSFTPGYQITNPPGLNTYYLDTAWQAFQQKQFNAERLIFDSLFRPLCLYAERITQHQSQAEDIVTDAIIAAFSIRDQFAGKENLKRYLYKVVHNACINFASQSKTRSRIHEHIRYFQQQDSTDHDPLESEIMRIEIMQEIYKEINGLPDQCRRIFTMIFIEQRRYEEIAEALRISVQTVRSQKHRAIELLRIRLLKSGRAETFIVMLGWLSSLRH